MTLQELNEQTFYLSELVGRKVKVNGKKIGKLADLAIMETSVTPIVTDVIVSRPFGYKSLIVPWAKVGEIDERELVLNLGKVEDFEKDPEGLVLLQDHIMDKKIVDLEDHEVEVVYDVKLALRNKVMFVSDVDCSRYSFLRRLGLKRLVSWINGLADSLQDTTISWKYVQPLPKELGSFTGSVKLNVLKEKLKEIHPVDLADILEELDHGERLSVFNELDLEKASDTLEEVEPRVQRELISAIGEDKAADLIEEMTPAQAADVLSALPAADADEILSRMEQTNVKKIESIMDEHDKAISNFATSHFIKFLPETTVEQVFEQFREVAKDADVIWYLYVAAPNDKLLGVVNYHTILRAEANARLDELMVTGVRTLRTDESLVDAVEMFERYSFRAIPIVNEEDQIQGVIPYRDVMRLKHTLV
jgi:CBS domain-containing protein/sporulation protein YlmC with PRC-barrel domain